MTLERVTDDIVARFTRRNHHLTERFLKGGIDQEDTLRGMQLLAEGKALLEVPSGGPYDRCLDYTLYQKPYFQREKLMSWNSAFEWDLDSKKLWVTCSELLQSIDVPYHTLLNPDAEKQPYLLVAQLASPLQTLLAYCKVLAATQNIAFTYYRDLLEYSEEDFRLSEGVEFIPNSLKLVRIDLRANYDSETSVSAFRFRGDPNAAWVEAIAAAALFTGWLHTMELETMNRPLPHQPCIALAGCEFRPPNKKNFYGGLILQGQKDFSNFAGEDWSGTLSVYDCRARSKSLAVPTVETVGAISLD